MTILGPDLVLDAAMHDLVMTDGALRLEAKPEQAIKQALLLVRGEWFLDQEVGIPYHLDVFVKGVDVDRLRVLYRAAILGVPSVAAVRAIEVGFVGATRRLEVTWTADTDAGLIDGKVQV